jgi:hypothetical protein
MKSRIRLISAVVLLAVLGFGLRPASALVVTDPATTAKNILTAVLKSQMVDTLTEQARRLRRMGRRLSAFADLGRYLVPDSPRWRSYRYQDTSLYATAYEDALNLGDPDGAAYAEISRPRASGESELSTLRAESPSAADALAAQLATLDLADSTMMLGTDMNGRLRSQGKREMRAIDSLERDVTGPSLAGGTAAVLDQLSAAVLIETRQKQSRLEFLTAILAQLAVDSKRARDSDAAAMNMQLGRLRLAAECGEGCPGFLSGAGTALRSWRQP